MYRVATVNVRNTAIMTYVILHSTHIDMGLPIYLKVCRFTCERLAISMVDSIWKVMAHTQKPDLVFRRNGRVHLNRRGTSVQSTTGSWGVRISGSNAGYTMFRGSVKGTGYPFHSPVSPSLPLPCVTMCHHIYTGLYNTCVVVRDLNLSVRLCSVFDTVGR